MTTILAAIFVFGVLITVHEFGHFITAKMTGMRVDEFAIGFGPNIFQKKVGETLYSLRIIPLGGYNKIAGMDPEEPDSDDSFKSKSIPARMLVILAGSLMNFLLPIILFYVLRNNALKGNEENTTDVIDGMLIFKCVIIAVVIGVYDGIYGPGTGTFLMLLFTGFCHMTLNDAAGTTKAINLTTNITALVVFLINGKVLLPLGIAAGVCNMAGNYLGSHSFTSNGHKIVKPVMIVVIVIFFIKVLTELI